MININNPYLSFAIQTELYNLNIISFIEFNRTQFYLYHLQSIKRIDIVNCSTLDGIQHLTNLEILNIFNDATNTELGIYNKIQDFSLISSLKKLRKLYILNDLNIKNLDLNGLVKLEELVLLCCQNIQTLTGIQQLKKLKQLILVGNGNLCLTDFDSSLENIVKIQKVILDIVFYQQLFISNLENNKWLFEKERPNILFAEKIGFGEIYLMKPVIVAEMYNRSLNILRDLLKPNMTDYEIISKIYDFVVKYLSYDWDTLKKREDYFLKNAYYPLLFNKLMDNFRRINSSYGAFYNGKVICEGYVNMMRFLLSIVGFDTRVVYNSIKVRNSNSFNHAALAINFDNEWYFSDPEFYRTGNNKVLMTLNEFETDHRLSQMDKKIYDLFKSKNKK